MENAKNPFVLVKENKTKFHKKWVPTGKCGFNFFGTTPHLL
jgi:hypothetical protein